MTTPTIQDLDKLANAIFKKGKELEDMMREREGGDIMATYSYIRASGIRKIAKQYKKQCCADFLSALDRLVYDKVVNACLQFNGHRKRLTADLIRRK